MDDRIYQDLVNAYYNLYEARVDDNLTPSQKMDARRKRSGDPNEVTRQARHLFGRYQKTRRMNEKVVIEYLLDGGITDSEEGAEIIMQNMSEEWYNFIVEGRDDNKNKNVAELSSDLATLRKQQKELTAQLITNPTDTTLQNKLKRLIQQIKNSSGERSTLAGIQGRTSNTPPQRRSEPESAMTPEERGAFRVTRSKVPTGTPEQRAATREGLKRRPATAGQTPQSTGMNLAPVTTRTRAQSTVAAASDAIVGGKDPSYYDKQGNRVPLISQGETERTYNVSGGRTTASYQQGATGSSTRGPTPAGSTVDPERQKGPRGTGRRPQQ